MSAVIGREPALPVAYRIACGIIPEVRSDTALELLRSLRPTSPGIEVETGYRRDAVFLRMWVRSDPDRWIVIHTPGDRWFSVELPGGFSLDHFEEDAPDERVKEVLSGYVDLAVQYLRDGGITHKSRWLRVPSVVIATSEGKAILRRSVAREVQRLVTLRLRR